MPLVLLSLPLLHFVAQPLRQGGVGAQELDVLAVPPDRVVLRARVVADLDASAKRLLQLRQIAERESLAALDVEDPKVARRRQLHQIVQPRDLNFAKAAQRERHQAAGKALAQKVADARARD